MVDNILLIGFMGVGKGRTARALAAASDCFALDTDDLIEAFVKMKIRTLFAQQQVVEWLEGHGRGTIVSTGGGFFMVNNLKQIGRVVYLHSTLKGILATLNKHPNVANKIKKRPLLQDMDKARALYQYRLPLYREVADYEISVEGRRTSEVVAEIKALLVRDKVL